MLSLDILKMIYFACVHSHLVYGIEIYANTHMKNINKLVILNNKILRILQNVSRDTHTVELLYILNFYSGILATVVLCTPICTYVLFCCILY